jgi:hypothetical protein
LAIRPSSVSKMNCPPPKYVPFPFDTFPVGQPGCNCRADSEWPRGWLPPAPCLSFRSGRRAWTSRRYCLRSRNPSRPGEDRNSPGIQMLRVRGCGDAGGIRDEVNLEIAALLSAEPRRNRQCHEQAEQHRYPFQVILHFLFCNFTEIRFDSYAIPRAERFVVRWRKR